MAHHSPRHPELSKEVGITYFKKEFLYIYKLYINICIFLHHKLAFWKSISFILGCSGSSLRRVDSLWSQREGLLSGWGERASPVAASLVAENGLWDTQAAAAARRGLSSCGSRALELRLSGWTFLGLVALWHVGSSWVRDRTCVSCIGQENSLPWSQQGSPWNILWCLVIIQILSRKVEKLQKVEKKWKKDRL